MALNSIGHGQWSNLTYIMADLLQKRHYVCQNGAMIDRIMAPPKKSFLLLGPRGVGKSTFLKQKLSPALTIDLLHNDQYLPLLRNPSFLREKCSPLKAGDWVVIDEIQRIPELLNEVHSIYEEKRLHFALSGSSARKLKRGGANLLAGRALQKFMYPLAWPEFPKNWSLNKAIEWGTLPGVVTDDQYKVQTLSTYVQTYLRQELLEEGLIRKADPFMRFLSVAGLLNGQILNLENVSRDAHVGRTTIQTYFEILEDTLIGYRLPAYRVGAKVKEASHSKFYLFDPGVARACADSLRSEVESEYRGFLFETLLLQQIRAYNFYADKDFPMAYYRISGGSEIDLIVETRKRGLSRQAEVFCFEFKSSKKWDPRWNKAINELAASGKLRVKRKIGIYLGAEKLEKDGFEVWPAEDFLQELFAGHIF